MSDKTPCLNCKKRQIGCHAECKDYADYVEAKEQLKETIRRETEIYAFKKQEQIKRFNREIRKGKFRSSAYR